MQQLNRMISVAGLLISLSGATTAQQVADTSFIPASVEMTYRPGRGPLVLLDEAHNNFHTVDGRYLAFAAVLRRDGFVVEPLVESFSEESLAEASVLVIANAISEVNVDNWVLPTPSAFTDEEIESVFNWVEQGGSLLLLADHMPFPGAAAKLGERFGFEFLNGYAYENDSLLRGGGPIFFRTDVGTLKDHAVIRGRTPDESVSSVATFTGQAFRVPESAHSIFVFREGSVSLQPDTAWVFSDETLRTDVSGWSQGAVLEVGEGRIAVFGEAAMFSAQVQGPNRRPMGMNRPDASENMQFLLNVMHWLARTD
ncbi:MAG: DUF4350 domain-containing protein [Gemmatimonadota bacterium]|nr:DUF4350 domain-containing protein [Gemmatimonadota bacterium]